MTFAQHIAVASAASLGYTRQSHTRNLVWTADGVGYFFYKDAFPVSGNSDLVYRKTSDGGANWSAAIPVGPVSICWDIWYSKWTDTSFTPYIHIWSHDDSGARGMYYNRLDPATDTLLNGASGLLLRSLGAAPSGNVTSCAVSLSGKLHCFGPATHKISADNGATFTDGDTSFGASTSSFGYLFPDGVSADTDDMLMVWRDHSSALLKVVQYDASGTVWGTPVTIAAFHGADFASIFLTGVYNRSNGRIYVAFIPEDNFELENIVGLYNIVTYDLNGTTATQRTNVLVNTNYVGTLAMVRFSTGTIRVYYSLDVEGEGFTGEQKVYYKESTDEMVTWGAQTEYSTAPEGRIVWIHVDQAPVHDNELGVGYQFSFQEEIGLRSHIWFEAVPDEGEPPVTPPVVPPLIFKCMDGVDGVGVVSFSIDGTDVFRCIDVDGVSVVRFVTDSYPLVRAQ